MAQLAVEAAVKMASRFSSIYGANASVAYHANSLTSDLGKTRELSERLALVRDFANKMGQNPMSQSDKRFASCVASINAAINDAAGWIALDCD